MYWAWWGVCWINPESGRCSLFPSRSGKGLITNKTVLLNRTTCASTYFVLFIPISAATASSFVLVRLIKMTSIPSFASWKTDKETFSLAIQSSMLLYHTQQRYAPAYKCAQLSHCSTVNENVTDNINTGNSLGRTDETKTQKKTEHCKIHNRCFVYHWLKN